MKILDMSEESLLEQIIEKLGAQSEVDTIYLDKLKRWETRINNESGHGAN